MYTHKDTCSSLSRPMNVAYDDNMCDCGFREALAIEVQGEVEVRDQLAREAEAAWIAETIVELERMGYEIKKVKK